MLEVLGRVLISLTCTVVAKNNNNNNRMFENFGVDQQLEDVRDPKGTKQWLQETRFYIENIVRVEDRYAEVSSECLNRDAMCTAWAVDGYCEPDNENYAYMELQCAPACRTCHNLIFEERCPWDSSNATNAWKPGSLDSMFQRITQEPYYVHEYSPSILSRPGGDPHDDSVKDGPWIVVLDNFVKEDECDRLIDLGAQEGYQLSKDIGDRQFDGTYGDQESEYRTSTNAWCTESCYEDPATQQVVRRMENLTDIPDNYAEHFQLLRYQVGQFYGQHHDYSSHIKDRAEGVRILTVFFYLNDVEQGGGTRFPLLDITVTPKKGRALVWPSVLNDAPHDMDERTEHEALPVQEGIKYGANAWVHMRDFKTPYADGCAT